MGWSWVVFAFMLFMVLSSISNEAEGAFAFFLTFFIVTLTYTINTSLKRARWQITEIEATPTDFLISVLHRDTMEGYSIPTYAIHTDLRWVPYERTPIIKLTLFDNDTELFSAYSNTSKRSEYELEDIVFQMRKELKASGRDSDDE